MWSDEFDKKINDAAANDSHNYDEKSWQKMESLLDKHLPQEKRRRRFILFLLLFLLTGTSAVLIYSVGSGNNKSSVAEQKTNSSFTTEPTSQKISSEEPVSRNNGSATKKDQQPSDQEKGSTSIAKTSIEEQPIPANKNAKTTRQKSINRTKDVINSGSHLVTISGSQTNRKKKNSHTPVSNEASASFDTQKKENTEAKNIRKETVPLNPPTDLASGAVAGNNNKSEPQNNQPPGAVETGVGTKPTVEDNISKVAGDSSILAQNQDSAEPEKKENNRAKKGNQLIISLSGGPDISAVGGEPGKWQGQYGIGLGYALSKRFTVRTGFYVARKIYSADSTSYKAPINVVNYYYNLDNVNGNCLVYEIPVTVVYNITTAKKHSWFVSTGLSSYLMKTEDYECTYKNMFGQTQVHNYSYNNKNSHFFSVINFSGGYQYNFTDRFSFMAEPYIKMPLSGVGIGKVKLNSAGILFTIGYKPFIKPKVNPGKK